MFKAISFFKIKDAVSIPSQQVLNDGAATKQFQPCEPTQQSATGWVKVRREDDAALVEDVAGHLVLRLHSEHKSVPASAVKKEVDARAEQFFKETGRKVGTKGKRDIKEAVVQEFLPRAFAKESSTMMVINKANGLIVIGSASDRACDEIITKFIEIAGEGVVVVPVHTVTSPAAAMAVWLSTQEDPYQFATGDECELKAADEMRSAVKYSRHDLCIQEVADHIKQGKVPTKVAMTFRDRVSFILTDRGRLTKLQLLDVVLDEGGAGDHADGFAADVAITMGELNKLIPALIDALGGEDRATQPIAGAPGLSQGDEGEATGSTAAVDAATSSREGLKVPADQRAESDGGEVLETEAEAPWA